MGLIAAVGAYIFTAYTLGKPAHAPFASFLGGVVTFLVGWFCLSLVDDVYDFSFPVSFQYTNIISSADTLYMCYCIDVDRGAMHKAEVFDAVRLGSYLAPVTTHTTPQFEGRPSTARPNDSRV